MTHNKIDYVTIFHNHGYRLTKQREAILDAICQINGHATLGEIFAHTRKLDDSIDRSTLYRAVEAFVKLGLVICAEDVNGERVYELVRETHHHHLVCKQCGYEIEIETRAVEAFFQFLQQEYEYKIEMDHLIVSGLCPSCARAEVSPASF